MEAKIYNDFVSVTALSAMTIRRGRVVEISDKGEIFAESDPEKASISCSFLRTSAAPKPRIKMGDLVLYILDESKANGYILGLIESDFFNDSVDERTTARQEREPTSHLKLNANEKIEFVCGKSMLSMNKEGKICIRGETITSRSRGTHKIKGGSVQIN